MKPLRPFALWLCFVSALGVVPNVVADDAGLQFRADLEQILAEENLTGIAWAIVDEDGARVDAAGLRDKPEGITFTPDTRVHVGSITKAVLATGVLRLATQGLLDLDDPIVGYLPEFAGAVSAEFDTVTIRHLLDHTSGLNDAYLWQMFSERARPDAALIDAFPDPSKQLSLRSRPGTQFSYSNMGYTLAGMVIESVVGERYESYLDRHLLAPLGMHQSTFAFTTQEGEGADPGLAWGHIDDGSSYAAQPVFLRPAAQLTTSAKDLAIFATHLLGDGQIGNESFIDPALMRARGKAMETHAADHGLLAGYALGLGRRDRHGVVGFCHGGNTLGFVAMLCVFPDERRAFAYSVNTDSEVANYGRLNALFVAALQVSSTASEADAKQLSPATRSDLEQWRGCYVYSPNRFNSFRYLDLLFGAIKVESSGEALTLKYLQRGDRTLRPTKDNRFIASGRQTESHVFYRYGPDANDEFDTVFLSDGFRSYKRVSGSFLAFRWLSFILGVLGLVWILLYGAVQLFRVRRRFSTSTVAPAFVVCLLLFAPIPLFFTQNFMALGDVTLASACLALVTGLLPIGMLATLVHCLVSREWRAWVHVGVPAVCVLQWCIVLASYSLLPLRLWA